MQKEKTNNSAERPPVIVVMGHIDHGKSSLLDYIRKTNIVEKEAGGITQRITAYELKHKDKKGKEHFITFLDTPGHSAFQGMRSRGAKVADIAILVVSAEDGVKPQTLEALRAIKEAKIPYIVAINKIDKENANIEQTKQSLAENEIYIEGYGGDVPCVPISAKTGSGVDELLDMMLLVAEVENLKGDPKKSAEGVVIEARLDPKKGIYATLIVKDGTLKTGDCIIAGQSISTARMMENFLGKKITEATFGTPVRIIGWSSVPEIGLPFAICQNKKEAEVQAENSKKMKGNCSNLSDNSICEGGSLIPVVLKADVAGTIEAVKHEIEKIQTDKVKIKILSSGVGTITENDVKTATAKVGSVILGFNVKTDAQANAAADRLGIKIETFDIIYKLTEWLENIIKEKTPKVMVEMVSGRAKILKSFSRNKDKQVVGGRVENGLITIGSDVRILRREAIIGNGRIKELQSQKLRVDEVREGTEFGSMIQSSIEIAPGDRIECFTLTPQ